MTTGEKIRQARKDAGLTQAELTNIIGMYLKTLSKIENDKYCPNHQVLLKIAAATGKPPEYFGWAHADPEATNLTELTPGQVLKLYRTNKNLTQTTLANVINVRQYVIRHWENGTKIPNNSIIQRTAKYLDINPELLGYRTRPDFTDTAYKNRPNLVIRHARINKGLTQTAIANLLNLPRQTVYQWEDHPIKISPKFIPKLAKILDISEDLLSYNTNEKEVAYENEACDTQEHAQPGTETD